MNILLLGFGKMGRAIEPIALDQGHQIVGRIDVDTPLTTLDALPDEAVDVAIEFSAPDAVMPHIRYAVGRGWPVVCGTTGWLSARSEVERLVTERQGAFFYASNYSIGVNLFFRLNKTLATFMHQHPTYRVSMTEIHHTEKKDAPSGTALTLAEGIGTNVPIESRREGMVPGTHTVRYESDVDRIEITHVAHSRQGFAVGAVIAAEWLVSGREFGRQGIFGMNDLLGE